MSLAIISHRGPDDSGIFCESGHGLSVGLGSQRLSIIDLTPAGHQPMSNETGDIWLAYNGEIYNHQELRAVLEARGHRYSSRTDTETVLHAYEEYDLDCLHQFNGIFAFALYDRLRARVLLVRDRMGVKPLYYSWNGQTLAFASELKALLAYPSTPKRLDCEALQLYLSLGYVPSPFCLLAGIRKLTPGSYLLIEAGQLRQSNFWSPHIHLTPEDGRGLGNLVTETRSVITSAVERQLMSDVPLGVFLSGGLDSSIVTAIAQRTHSGPLDTFSVGFADTDTSTVDPIYNADLLHARQVAKLLGTRHHEVILTGPELPNLLRQLAFSLDEPLWEASFASLSMMARLARDTGISVVLTGDGGDELFGGYPWYIGTIRSEWAARLPLIRHALPLLSTAFGEHSIGRKSRDLWRRLGQSDVVKYRLSYDIFGETQSRAIQMADLSGQFCESVTDRVLQAALTDGPAELPDRLALADLRLWVREHFNHRVDRMSMAHSVEARVPLQDNDVVDFALGIGLRRKLHGGQAKYLLREAFREILPPEVLRRPKRPFAVPASSWLRGPLRDMVYETLSRERLGRFGILRPEPVQQLAVGFLAGTNDLAFQVWVLLMLQLWCEAYLT